MLNSPLGFEFVEFTKCPVDFGSHEVLLIIQADLLHHHRLLKRMNLTENAKLRAQFNYSQSIFARFLNVSTKFIQAGEQRLRELSNAALNLLMIAVNQPAVLLGPWKTGANLRNKI